MLIADLRDVLARPKFRRWVSEKAVADYVEGLTDTALLAEDPPAETRLSPDPDDDYLVTLARAAGADYLVSGDRHLRPSPSGPAHPYATRVLDRLVEGRGG